jgi:hypothetical protein
MAISLVQSAAAASAGSTNIAFTSTNTGGNLLVALWRATAATPSILDSQTNIWSTPVVNTGSGIDFFMSYAQNCKAGANTVTPNMSGGLGVIAEFNGINISSPFDQQNSAATSSAAQNSGSVTTTKDGELILGGFYANAPSTITPTAPQVLIVSSITTGGGQVFLTWAVQTSKGAISASGTSASQFWIAGIATFAPTPPPTPALSGDGPMNSALFPVLMARMKIAAAYRNRNK